MPEVQKRRNLPNRTLEFPDSLPGFALRTSTILFQLVQGLLRLNHALCDELLLCEELVLWPGRDVEISIMTTILDVIILDTVFAPEKCLDHCCPGARLDAARDGGPGEEEKGD